MFYSIILLLFPFANSISYHTTTIAVSRGASFMNYFTTFENETITECRMKYLWKNKTYTYIINMNEQQDFGGDEIQTKFRNIGRNTCGIHMVEAIECPSPLIFNITYLDVEGKEQKFDGFFPVTFLDIKLGDHEPELAKLGEKLPLRCDGSVHQWNLVNPEGVTVFSAQKANLKYEIARATMKDIGRWTCVPFMRNTMEVTTRPFDVSVTDKVYKTEGWYKEKDGYGIIGCSTDVPINELVFCVFETPEKKVHTIGSTSVASVRYTTLGTDFENSTCQIEFKLPLQAGERGQWKCSLGEVAGTYITTDPTKPLDYKKSYDIITAVGTKNVLVTCPVPYSMDSCVIHDPSNTPYYYYIRERYQVGDCSHTIPVMEAKDVGLWKCMISSPTRSEDEHIEVIVRTYETLSAVYKDIEADEGDEINLRCSSGSAIILCQFIDPTGKMYTMNPEKKVEDMKYLGKGLHYGDCGIAIKSLSKSMVGTWTCRVMTSWNLPSKFMSDTIRVTVNETGPAISASSIGIFVGVGAALILIVLGALIARFRSSKKRKANQPVHSNDSSPSRNSISSGSSVEIPIGRPSVVHSIQSALGSARDALGRSSVAQSIQSARGSARDVQEEIMLEVRGGESVESREDGGEATGM